MSPNRPGAEVLGAISNSQGESRATSTATKISITPITIFASTRYGSRMRPPDTRIADGVGARRTSGQALMLGARATRIVRQSASTPCA